MEGDAKLKLTAAQIKRLNEIRKEALNMIATLEVEMKIFPQKAAVAKEAIAIARKNIEDIDCALFGHA